MVRAQTIKRELQASDAPVLAVVCTIVTQRCSHAVYPLLTIVECVPGCARIAHGRLMRVLVHVLLDAPYETVQIAHHNCARNHLEVDEEGRFQWAPHNRSE